MYISIFGIVVLLLVGLYAWRRIVDLKDQLQTVQANTARLREILYDKHQTLRVLQKEYDGVCIALNDVEKVRAHLNNLVEREYGH